MLKNNAPGKIKTLVAPQNKSTATSRLCSTCLASKGINITYLKSKDKQHIIDSSLDWTYWLDLTIHQNQSSPILGFDTLSDEFLGSCMLNLHCSRY